MSNLSYKKEKDDTFLVKTSSISTNNGISSSGYRSNNCSMVEYTRDNVQQSSNYNAEDLISSTISFMSSLENEFDVNDTKPAFDLLGPKAEFVYSLSAMLGSNNRAESSQTLLLLSQDKEYNTFFRDSGCLNILIHLMHSNGDITQYRPTTEDLEVAARCSKALRNAVLNQEDERRRRHEVRLLQQLEILRTYIQKLRMKIGENAHAIRHDKEVCVAVALLMKFSFDQEDRRLTLSLGGLQAIAETLIIHQFMFGVAQDPTTIEFRKNIGMALTNLTFGAAQSKLILCSYPKFLESLNRQIEEDVDELRLVFASILRNLSWKADKPSKIALRNSGSVIVLVKAAMRVEHENALKTVLSALWNLSSHCTENKIDICAQNGILEFLVSLLQNEQKFGIAILENGGGILRDISSEIALNEEYRSILRRQNCFQILLHHLKSSSLTVVSNSCSTLWNLSAENDQDQATLIQHGALQLLSHLVRSRHDMISRSSMATLRNLLLFKHKTASSNNNSLSRSSNLSKNENRAIKSSVLINSHSSALANNGPNREIQPIKSTPVPNQPFNSYSYVSNSGCNGQGGSSTTRDEAEDIKIYATEPTPTAAFSFFRQLEPPLCSGNVARDEAEDIKIYATEPTPGGVSIRSSMSSLFAKCVASADNNSKDEEILAEDVSSGASSRRHQSSTNQQQHSGHVTNDQHVRTMPSSTTATGVAPDFSDYPRRSASVSFEPNTKVIASKDEQKDRTGANECQYRVVNNTSDIIDATAALSISASSSKPATVMPTPMMYSRHSSLQSLDSCDQQSVRSTVYSEYSQLPTGMHSPSELPDSPTQTCPPTPHSSKTAACNKFFAEKSSEEALGGGPVPPTGATSAQKSSPFRCNTGDNVFGSADYSAQFEQPRIYCVETASTISSFSALTVESGVKIKPTRQERSNVEDCIYSAMPKPRPGSSTVTPKPKKAAKEINNTAKIKPKAERTDVEDCIYSAMPKPRKGRQKNTKKEAHNISRDGIQNRSSSCYPPTRNGGCDDSDIGEASGLDSLESSTVQPDIDNMQISTSSNLIKVTATLENIKDAAALSMDVSKTAFKPPKFYKFESRDLKNELSPTSPSAGPTPNGFLVVKSSSDETNGSLSEDNYSRIEDDSFDLTIEDVDVDLLVTNNYEDDGSFDINVANVLSVGAEAVDKNSPEVLPGKNRPEKSPKKGISGDKQKQNLQQASSNVNFTPNNATGSLSTPKMPVRTTKTVELRITKRANESGTGTSRSASPFKSGSDAEAGFLDGPKFCRNTIDRRSQKSTTSSARSSPNPLARNTHSPAASIKNSPRSKPVVPPKPTALVANEHGASKLPYPKNCENLMDLPGKCFSQCDLPPTLCVVPPFSYSPSRSPKAACRTPQRSNVGSSTASMNQTTNFVSLHHGRPSPSGAPAARENALNSSKNASGTNKPASTAPKSGRQQSGGADGQEPANSENAPANEGGSANSKLSPSKRVLVTTV